MEIHDGVYRTYRGLGCDTLVDHDEIESAQQSAKERRAMSSTASRPQQDVGLIALQKRLFGHKEKIERARIPP